MAHLLRNTHSASPRLRAAGVACPPAWNARVSEPPRPPQTERRPPRERSGIILAAVLVSMLVVMLFSLALTRALVLHQQRIRTAEQSQQSFWLAESAVLRARHALDQSADYQGETWCVSAEDLPGAGSGTATIQVEPTPEDPTGRVIRVSATYPDNSLRPIVHSRELFVNLPRPGESP